MLFVHPFSALQLFAVNKVPVFGLFISSPQQCGWSVGRETKPGVGVCSSLCRTVNLLANFSQSLFSLYYLRTGKGKLLGLHGDMGMFKRINF